MDSYPSSLNKRPRSNKRPPLPKSAHLLSHNVKPSAPSNPPLISLTLGNKDGGISTWESLLFRSNYLYLHVLAELFYECYLFVL